MPPLDHPHFGRGIRPPARIVVGPPDHGAHPAVAGRPVQALCQTWRSHRTADTPSGRTNACRAVADPPFASTQRWISHRWDADRDRAALVHVADGDFLRSSSASRPR
jgi:hypothetical protein